ncbi:hypothetical protein RYZ26_11285 [Terasakiella sp. A23]|uniref:hypothetical protein n=1 Tax=Terasakiella sp. FCG-A23 TaxID=3080561 RepID=UPI002955B2A2|nr:hypothetical protein [Terasakiella sp. A23]MDV7340180.1 hypothetical protein [Terasakiella sp. A23]
MTNKNKPTPYVCLFISTFMLSGCAAPPALQVLSFALDGISYIATDKSVADHGLSVVAQRDCKMLRTLQGEEICQKNEPESDEILTQAQIDPAEPNALAE